MPNYFIFHSKPSTYQECLERKLFGASPRMGSFVRYVCKNDIIFVVQVSKIRDKYHNFIEGPFKATSEGKENIIPEAWGGGFPWQVTVDDSVSRNKIYYSDYKSFFEENGLHLFDDLFPPFRLTQTIGDKLLDLLGIVLDTTPVHANPTPISIESDFRKKYKANFLCADGHYVRSLSEKTIDDWLYHNNILHSYERKLPIMEPLYSDFYIKKADCYIEYWGMNDDPLYAKRKLVKKEIYMKYNYQLIELEFIHLSNLDDILPQTLLKYGYSIK